MSSIPYNYGSYIDAKVAMTDTGHVSAGKQIQSPASAGSRGLAKTTQFTNNPTQMKMGESITMEDMKSLISRIDGLNVPTNEAPKDSDIDYAKLMLQISAMKDKIAELPIDDDRKTSALTALGQVEDDLAMDESAVREDAGAMDWSTDKVREFGDDLIKVSKGQVPDDLLNIDDLEDGWADADQASRDEKAETIGGQLISVLIGYLQFSAGQKPSAEDIKGAQEVVNDPEFKKAYHSTESVSEHEDELSRLKELSGMEAPKESEETVSEDIDERGRIALEKAGFDPMKVKEYMAVFNDHGDTSDIDQMNMDKVGLADAMSMVLASHDVENESYQPFPEGDEFDIEEDEDFEEVLGPLGFPEDETELFDAEYQGRKVPLNKPMRGDVKKFKVYVKDPKTGNVKKVNFGHGGTSAKRPTMRIRKSNPKARKSFRARHNCANPGPKTKARYWSCRKW